ncbi:MAG: hypothetical protein PHR19_02505 [Bacteroidales bacterium]|nr:hypothetical protein [Bacteroidales bacterium]
MKLYDFTPDYIFGRILLAIVIGITIATAIVFVRTAHAINSYPAPDYLVSQDMASYMQHEGSGQEFTEEDMQ